MNIVIPPIFFYAVGTMMVVFGVLRALLLGRHRPERELTEESPARAKLRRNHMIFGVIYVLTGAFLIVLTTGVIRLRSGM